MGGITAKEANQLQAGDKVKVGPGLYLRRNTDDTVTCWGRLKVAGRSVDVQCGRESLPISSAGLKSLLTEGASARHEHSKRKPLQTAASTVGGGSLSRNSSVGEVWESMLRQIDANGKWTPTNRQANMHRVVRHLEPSALWKRPVGEVRPGDVADLLGLLGNTPGQQTKIRSLLSKLFTFALANRWADINPARDAGAILLVTSNAHQQANFPTSTDSVFLRQLYQRFTTSNSSAAVRQALQLQALTCQRTGEIVGARWEEFDLDSTTPTWVIPRARMKIKFEKRGDHKVPLSGEAVALLRSMRRVNEYVFPGHKGQPITTNALPKMMRVDLGLGGVFVPHSWRSAFRTAAVRAVDQNEMPLFSESWLESVLDHGKADKVLSAYDRGQHTDGARRALEWWAGVICGGEA